MSGAVWGVAGTALVLLLVLAAAFLLRLRQLAGRVGSFECAMRPAGQSRWMSGIAVFGGDSVQWYRLMSLSWRPRARLDRSLVELEQVRHRGRDGRIVDVTCRYDGTQLDLAMLEDSHSALVAWLESAAPHQPALF